MGAAAPAAGPIEAPADEVEWPDETDESEFLSDSANRNQMTVPVGERASAPVVGEKLPPLDQLVARVPEGIRSILDDLFRAKFTGVRKFAPAVRPGDPK